MTNEQLQQIILTEIDRVFLNNHYPGDHGIGGEEVSTFRGKWQDISLEMIIYNRSSIAEFSTEGFAYYLPAFLKAIITYHDEVDTLVYTVLTRLVPTEVFGGRYLAKVIEELNGIQKLVIRDFLISYKHLFPNDIHDYGPITLYNLERAIIHWTNEAILK
jgi:hypothetical protein